ncbi:MAG: CTP synthase [Gammaproteobacteria bacterium]|nr:MAG: CTP synthase [Gammaproteobacteria bacterium]|tara:strand:+ start:4400 stop:6019 length:1620 start_codon:yes stop_codon:yes gene_type:complete
MASNPKYLFVTGGVVSSLGKGIFSASLGAILESRGLKVTIQKLDPYINLDPGTMSPFQHGEVFVTEDGSETDLDLGHYERFLDSKMSKLNNFTAGQVYEHVLKKERKGDFLGSTVQVIPHITDEIKKRIVKCAKGNDIAIIEVGGTVGDIESQPFLEAIRQMKLELGSNRALFAHLTLIPFLASSGEIKTKPTQHSIKNLLSHGIQADLLICRSENPLQKSDSKKISLFTNVDEKCVFSIPDVNSIHSIPELLNSQGLDKQIMEKLRLKSKPANLNRWKKVTRLEKNRKGITKIAMVGKYTELADSYKSVNEALVHAGIHNKTEVEIEYFDSQDFNKGVKKFKPQGILIPGGFGGRGINGMINVAKYARTKNIPYLGICLGMQVAVIEFARNVLKLSANSTEFEKNTKHPVIALITEWMDKKGLTQIRNENSDKGGTMRLGSQVCILEKNSKMSKMYDCIKISERHRHRYEFNSNYLKQMKMNGMNIVGFSEDKNLVEAIELKGHKWFVGCQFHPEFTSDPRTGHPLFNGFVRAAKVTK